LAWDLKVGPKLQRLLDQEKAGRSVPELLSRPVLNPTEEMWMETFEKLSTERNFGMGVGPIPYSAALRFALLEKFEEYEVWYIIKELDDMWRTKVMPPAAGGQGGGLSNSGNNRPQRRGSRKSERDAGS
jgi:hypothetical protein